MKHQFFLMIFTVVVITAGCLPTESEQVAAITQIAEGIIATQTAQAPTPTTVPPTPVWKDGDTRVSLVDGMTQIFIPAGDYLLGSNQEEIDWAMECGGADYTDEAPQYSVQLDSFWIDQTEVTVAMFRQFVDETGYLTLAERTGTSYVYFESDWSSIPGASWQDPGEFLPPGTDIYPLGEDHPVGNVSWYDAFAYCEWAVRRLPTEVEWEAAARGTDQRRFPWGDELTERDLFNLEEGEDACYQTAEVDDGYEITSPVMDFPDGASPFGVLGMAGNVKEWVYDWYSQSYSNVPLINPVNIEESGLRVARGGSYASQLVDSRTANRRGLNPTLSFSDFGFRCVESEHDLMDPPSNEEYIADITLLKNSITVYLFPDTFKIGSIKDASKFEITGQYGQCMYLRVGLREGMDGWITMDDSINLNLPCSSFEEVLIRPLSSTLDAGDYGRGILTVTNLGSSDAVVILLEEDHGSEEQSFGYWTYVRVGEEVVRTDIPNANYQVYLTSGSNWDPSQNRFLDALSYEKLDEPMEFTSDGNRYTTWQLSLDTTEGEASSLPVDENDFPQ
ncbi:MAG: formylglycine-generating enzyme family protein [Anaerolineales bacterium]